MKKKHSLKNLVEFFFKKKLNIIDCGAHKGAMLDEIGLKKIKKGILIDPQNFDIIKKKNLNRKNFFFEQRLLGSTTKKINFYYYSKKNPEWNSSNLITSSSPYRKLYNSRLDKKPKIEKLQQITIDNLLLKYKIKIDLLKIGCQSSTLPILKGAKKLIKKKGLKMIICAINNANFYKDTDDFLNIITYLKKFDFKLYSFANAHSHQIGKVDYDFKSFQTWTFDAVFIK